MLVTEADQIGFNPFTFFNLHAILSENLLPDEDACGRLRRRPVEISGSVFLPLAMPQVLEESFRLVLQKAAAIPDPFEQAFFVMVSCLICSPSRTSTSVYRGYLIRNSRNLQLCLNG